MSEEQTIIPDDKLAALEAESAERLAGWQRARADYQNLKREYDEKMIRLLAEGKAAVLKDFLPVYDHLKQATQSPPDPEHLAQWTEGITKIREQLDALLKKWNVKTVETVGQAFDPHVHEALQQEGGDDVVIKELQAGYTVDDKLLYPAKVVVGNKDSQQS